MEAFHRQAPRRHRHCSVAGVSASPPSSIVLEGVPVVELEARRLSLFAQVSIAADEDLDLRAHEAAERVLRRAHDRLAANIETRVDDHRAAGLLPEGTDKSIIARFGLI